jgi:carotenoid 1,2-hydratase
VEVAFTSPGPTWRGTGYLDANFGSEPLEAGFTQWTWSRAHGRDGVTVIYDSECRDGSATQLALKVDADGGIHSFQPPALRSLPATRWGIPRAIRADSEGPLAVRATLESAPFYARSLIDAELLGEPVTLLHESLSLERFQAGWVKALLPFRMPRRT